ncbi:MAG: redoxin family protein [Terracidiphilus sp.]
MMRASYFSFAICLLCSSALPCRAQYQGTAEAKSVYQLGSAAVENGKYMAALADFQKAIALDPDYADAWEQLIWVEDLAAIQKMGLTLSETDPKLRKRERKQSDKVTRNQTRHLQALARKHPDKPIYLWALGQIYNENDPLRQEQYCRQAIQVDAQFAPGYKCLASIADLRGDDAGSSVYWQKDAALDPDNAQVAFDALFELQNDPAAYKDATERLLRRFPTDPIGAQALYWLADQQKTDAARVEVLERLRRQFPPQKFDWSDNGMGMLFEIEDHTDPAKARDLAHDMVRVEPKDDDWKMFAAYADSMAAAEQELKAGDAAAALSTLKSAKFPNYSYDKDRATLLHARALAAAGKTADAYAFLLDAYARHPGEELGSALLSRGAALGKSADDVHAAVWDAVEKASKPAIPFTLPSFEEGKSVSLADYRGHVVLVDFWFPNCGPCRQSFPYLEDLARNYKEKGVVVLAINGEAGQEPFVLPLLKAKGYDFVPLKGDSDWDESVYHVRGYPTTFLIGPDGRQYFRPHIYNDAEEQSTALEIDELLAHSGGA